MKSTNLNLLKLLTFVIFGANSILQTYLALYFDYLGFTKLQIGALSSIGPLVGMFSTLLWGFVSDRFRTIKKILILLFIGQLAVTLGMLTTTAYGFLFGLVAAYYFFQQPQLSLTDSLNMLTAKQHGTSYASLRIWGSLGFAAASLIVGSLTTAYGSGITVYLGAGSAILMIAVSLFIYDVSGSRGKFKFSGMKKVLLSSKFVWFLVLVLFISTVSKLNDNFLGIYMRELGASNTLIGWSLLLSSSSEIATFYYLSKHGHKYKELPLIAIAAIGYAVRFLIVSVSTNIYVILSTQLMHSITFGIFFIMSIRYIQMVIPDEYRASGQAVYAAIWSSAGGLISGLIGGSIYDFWGGASLYRFASTLAVFTAALILVTHWQYKRKSI